jgi:hypothetical protein
LVLHERGGLLHLLGGLLHLLGGLLRLLRLLHLSGDFELGRK